MSADKSADVSAGSLMIIEKYFCQMSSGKKCNNDKCEHSHSAAAIMPKYCSYVFDCHPLLVLPCNYHLVRETQILVQYLSDFVVQHRAARSS